ncbi:MAG: T9SS type A sorting domain-containing protein, partial [Bacteroidota bacterium]
NYPNPFNPSTLIRFSVPIGEKVSLKVFDMTGKEVATLADGILEAGSHSMKFDASRLASGTYFYRLTTARYTETRKMLLVK